MYEGGIQQPGGTQVIDHAVQAFTVQMPEVNQLVSRMEQAGAAQLVTKSDGAFTINMDNRIAFPSIA